MNSVAVFNCSIDPDILKKLSLSVDHVYDFSISHHHEILIWNNNYPFTSKQLRAFPHLRLFINWGTTDHNIEAERVMIQRGIQIKKVDYYATEAIAEYVLGLLFHFERKINRLLKQQKYIGTELRERKVGIIGLGKIGFRIAQMFKNLYFCTIYYTAKSDKQIPGFFFSSIKKMFQECDYLIIAAKPKTCLIDKNLLRWSNKNLIIINIADDQILPFKYIYPLLRDHRIRGFIGDLEETLDESRINLENVLFTKHYGYLTLQAKQIKSNVLALFLKKYFAQKEDKGLYIYIARHGQTMWNQQKIFQGSLDSPLSKEGKNTTKQLAHYFNKKNVSIIFSSPLKRAYMSTKIIASHLHKQCMIIPEFREMNFGIFEGKRQDTLKRVFQEFFHSRKINPYYHLFVSYPEGESYFDIYLRVLEKITSLSFIHDNFVIVGHESVNRILRGIITERTLTEMVQLRQKNNEIIAINLTDNSEQVIRI